MKKIFIAMAAVAALASCSKNEVSDFNPSNPNVINFSSSTTRATVNDLAALQGSTAGFGVFAENTATPTTFISNQAYKYTAGSPGSWGWDGTPVEWPTATSGYPINFYAYYPTGSTTLTATKEASYTIAATADAQVDLLAATNTVTTRPASSNVSLDFKHILSKLDFNVVAGKGTKVYVQSIAVKNVGNDGTFNYSSMSWTTAPSTFASSYDFRTYAGKGAAQEITGTTEDAADAVAVTGNSGSLMLMPQSGAPAWDGTATIANAYIEVVYRISTTAGADVVGSSDAVRIAGMSGHAGETELFVKVGYPLTANWTMSKGYTYNIFLGTASSSNGQLIDNKFYDEDGKQTGIDVVNPDGETIVVPSPITDATKPIGFTVTVTNWDTTTSATPLN